jgi:hypothetical protein
MSKITIETANEEQLDFLDSKIEEALMDGKDIDEDFVVDTFIEYETNYDKVDD